MKLLLRGPGVLRPALVPHYVNCISKFPPQRRLLASKACDPLRILFCGSEDFSIASLRALHKEHLEGKSGIASIDVVCRPGKWGGRGNKLFREVPIKAVAGQLGLRVHEIDTFTGWNPPTPHGQPVNLVIAVSFGLFVPPRILRGAKYGGLNVHPSFLPEFRGAAPIHHTLLAGCNTTGVTLQTLDFGKFDHGKILAQTPYPGIDIPNPETCKVQQLMEIVAPKGAEMLVQGIRDRVFVPPIEEAGWNHSGAEGGPFKMAPKITPADRHIDWASWSAKEIMRRAHVIGPLWSKAAILSGNNTTWKRLIFEDIRECSELEPRPESPGLPFLGGPEPGSRLLVGTCDGKLLSIGKVKMEGTVLMDGVAAVTRAGLLDISAHADGSEELASFRTPLV
ncbi:methionyl-tRNA formyltransferase family protein [Xylona heveae TC161]|uniref:methionyl-tRNA formyltransferase n=1 Tax=Xylona heveae (strain CBS 132557 / TC161) TaxID=1328760 RepID=A0A165J1Z3_XYLHT|nr:methionyl-tRNA formyltransferase family protein [Xylona heveae TC161]KZF25628.1 methionyl-tRNA formyltransferase family protein [Xylona heveae TC161]